MSKPENIYEMDLEAIDLEELTDITDSFTMGVLGLVMTDEQIMELFRKNLARSAAFKMCMRYVEAMQVLAIRAQRLYYMKENLDKLI